MAIKTYVLLENMDADAPVFKQTADGQRVQVKKIPFHRPTLRQEFQDKDGNSRVIRYKSSSKFIDQDLQIEKEKIEANAPFTTTERRDCEFRFGVLTTNKARAQEYVEAHPEMEGFDGTCDNVRAPKYRLLDEVGEAKIKNEDTRKRVKAASKVYDLNLEEAQALLIKLNGSFFKTPTDIDTCQNLLIDFIDDANIAGLDDVLKGEKEMTVDQKTTVLIGKLINAELLSFDSVQGKISKKKDSKWIDVREMSDEYSLDERMRLFSDFLNTEDGKPLRVDLEKDLSDFLKKKPKE